MTGSNSKMLSRDVMTAFRGRMDTVEFHPLSFREYYSYVGGERQSFSRSLASGNRLSMYHL